MEAILESVDLLRVHYGYRPPTPPARSHQREKAKDIVEALEPDRSHDEVELDEDGAEGQDAADDHREEQVQ
eukprot:5012792-Pleurochrysis_carterae.AAC.1